MNSNEFKVDFDLEQSIIKLLNYNKMIIIEEMTINYVQQQYYLFYYSLSKFYRQCFVLYILLYVEHSTNNRRMIYQRNINLWMMSKHEHCFVYLINISTWMNCWFSLTLQSNYEKSNVVLLVNIEQECHMKMQLFLPFVCDYCFYRSYPYRTC